MAPVLLPELSSGLHCAALELWLTPEDCLMPCLRCREMAETRLAGITQELREQERVLTGRSDASEASWSSLHSSLQVRLHTCASGPALRCRACPAASVNMRTWQLTSQLTAPYSSCHRPHNSYKYVSDLPYTATVLQAALATAQAELVATQQRLEADLEHWRSEALRWSPVPPPRCGGV